MFWQSRQKSIRPLRLILIVGFLCPYLFITEHTRGFTENDNTVSATRIIAGYLAKLPKFMIFENDSKDPLIVAVVGDDTQDMTSTLQTFVAQNPYARGREIRCVHIPYVANPFKAKKEPTPEDFDARNLFIESLRNTHLIYVTSSEDWIWRDIILKTSGSQALTVGNGRNFAKAGGMVSLVIRDNRLQFQINIEVLAEEGLTLSSQLLKHAELVRKGD